MDQFNFPDQINGFSRVEYLSVFIALLYAFAIAEFFMGWGKMLRQKDSMIFSRHHLLWTFIFFWGLILNWYILWQRIIYIDKGFLYFILILIPILLVFFSTVFLFPDFDKNRDMPAYYSKNQQTIILLFSMTLFINVCVGFFLRDIDLFAPANIIRSSISILGIVSVAFKLYRLQNLIIYVFLISIIAGTTIICIAKV